MTFWTSGGWGKPVPRYGVVREHDFRPNGEGYLSRCLFWRTRFVDFSRDQDLGPEPAAIGGKRCKVCWRLAVKEAREP